nr:hypothetical protein [Tanacetum cinerariifolium]
MTENEYASAIFLLLKGVTATQGNGFEGYFLKHFWFTPSKKGCATSDVTQGKKHQRCWITSCFLIAIVFVCEALKSEFLIPLAVTEYGAADRRKGNSRIRF